MFIPKYRIKEIRRIIKRILVIYWGYFGDVLITTPLLEVLRKGFPGRYITYALTSGRHGHEGSKVLERNPNVDKCMRVDKSFLIKLLTDEPYDLVIDLCGGKYSQLIAKISGAKVRLWGKFCGDCPYFFYSDCLEGEWSTPLKIKIPYIKNNVPYRAKQFLELGRFLGINIKKTLLPKIYLSQEERFFPYKYLKSIKGKNKIVIAIHPGGRIADRLWSPRNYALLADILIERYNAKVIVFYALGEKFFVNRICRLSHHKLVKIFERDIRKYILLISGCNLFISTDGGPLQIALALGVPAVGIFKDKYKKNTIYWYDYKKRKGLFSVFVKQDGSKIKKISKAKINERNIKEVGFLLRQAEEALHIQN